MKKILKRFWFRSINVRVKSFEPVFCLICTRVAVFRWSWCLCCWRWCRVFPGIGRLSLENWRRGRGLFTFGGGQCRVCDLLFRGRNGRSCRIKCSFWLGLSQRIWLLWLESIFMNLGSQKKSFRLDICSLGWRFIGGIQRARLVLQHCGFNRGWGRCN